MEILAMAYNHLLLLLFCTANIFLCVFANSPVALENGNLDIFAQGAAPMWFLPSGTCFPSDASTNNQQTNGVSTDHCNIHKLDHGCPSQPTWTGPNTNAPHVATYYLVRQCPDNSIRVAYDVYFKKDTGHESDWEWAVVIYNNIGGNNYERSEIVFEQDGARPRESWGNIQNTFDWYDDWQNEGQKNLNHPKLYFSKWHHSVHDDQYTAAFKDTCPPTSASDFRNNDYQWWSLENLQPAESIPANWNWGEANSFPMSFAEGGSHDLCSI